MGSKLPDVLADETWDYNG